MSRKSQGNLSTGAPSDASHLADDAILAPLLVQTQLMSQNQLEQALERRRIRGGSLLESIFGLGFLTPDDLVQFMLTNADAASGGLAALQPHPDIVASLPADLARRHFAVPMDRIDGVLLVGAPEPLSNEAIRELAAAAGRPVRTIVVHRDDVQSALELYYGPAAALPDAEGVKGALKLGHVAGLIRNINSLPALPETVERVQQALGDPHTSVADVVVIITMDPPIAAKVLSVANSAAYGFQQEITDLSLAVSLLGLRETYDIVLSVAVLDFLNKLKGFDYRVFWLESMCCAAAARIVAKAAGRRNAPGVFTAGLLHDLGRPALWEAVPELCRQIGDGPLGKELVQAEERLLGISHPEAGYELAKHWKLPTEIAETIRFHHRPLDAREAREHVAIVALADRMVHASGDTVEENRWVFEGQQPIFDIIGLDFENAEAMLADYIKLRDDALRDAEE